MKFDIGNILYIVITLVVVIVGVMGRKKKPAPTGSVPGDAGRQPQGGFMESLEKVLRTGQEDPVLIDFQEQAVDLYGEEVMGYEEAVPEPSPIVTADLPTFQEEYQQILDRLNSRESEIFLPQVDGNPEPLVVIDLEAQEGTDYFKIIKDFEAGTAIVYSAIINRVDY
ncbi:MAG: hypothetical protein V2B15_05040 [Bacteroidota bacterium]